MFYIMSDGGELTYKTPSWVKNRLVWGLELVQTLNFLAVDILPHDFEKNTIILMFFSIQTFMYHFPGLSLVVPHNSAREPWSCHDTRLLTIFCYIVSCEHKRPLTCIRWSGITVLVVIYYHFNNKPTFEKEIIEILFFPLQIYYHEIIGE